MIFTKIDLREPPGPALKKNTKGFHGYQKCFHLKSYALFVYDRNCVALYELSDYRACAVAAIKKSPRQEKDSGLADGDNALNLMVWLIHSTVSFPFFQIQTQV